VWARAARERRQHTIHLFDFVNPVRLARALCSFYIHVYNMGAYLMAECGQTFMAKLEEGALRAALMDWLKLLTLIDHVRTFALLNAVRHPPRQSPRDALVLDSIRNFIPILPRPVG
jgi:hypothetical protein